MQLSYHFPVPVADIARYCDTQCSSLRTKTNMYRGYDCYDIPVLRYGFWVCFLVLIPIFLSPVWIFFMFLQRCKTMQSHYRPGQALRVPGDWGSQISRQSAHEGGRVGPTHLPPLPPRKYSWYLFLLEAESTPRAIVRPEGLCQWKIPMAQSGIEPATFRLVAQCLNQLRHRGAYLYIVILAR